MPVKIHPTAVVDRKAELGPGVEIGPYAVVGPFVKMGARTRVGSHAVVEGRTTIGERCTLFPGACIGTCAQDKNAEDREAFVEIGNDNVIREYVTVHAASLEGAKTLIGDRNFLMAYAHVAHDCRLGSGIVMANCATLGGHVVVEDQVVLGGLSGVHQFVRIGRLAIVGGLSKVVQDVPPFSICDGNPGRLRGPNIVGLKRAGISSQDRLKIAQALKTLLASGTALTSAVQKVRAGSGDHPAIRHLLAFIESSKRGVVRGRLDWEEEESEPG